MVPSLSMQCIYAGWAIQNFTTSLKLAPFQFLIGLDSQWRDATTVTTIIIWLEIFIIFEPQDKIETDNWFYQYMKQVCWWYGMDRFSRQIVNVDISCKDKASWDCRVCRDVQDLEDFLLEAVLGKLALGPVPCPRQQEQDVFSKCIQHSLWQYWLVQFLKSFICDKRKLVFQEPILSF